MKNIGIAKNVKNNFMEWKADGNDNENKSEDEKL